MSIIPVDKDDIGKPPPRRPPLDESLTYHVALKRLDESPRPDKNGVRFLKSEVEVLDGEYKGRRIYDNYIRRPITKAQFEAEHGRFPNHQEIEDLKTHNRRFNLLVNCFKISFDSGSIETDHVLGREGYVTVRNEQYPPDTGDIVSRLNDYLDPNDRRLR
jgi:hypothetical protein